MNKNENLFSTYDIGLATALMTVGHKLYEMDRSNPKKACFHFLRVSTIDKAVDDYWVAELKVDARSFFENLKTLKNRIYSI